MELAKRAVDSIPVELLDQRILDLGCGPGFYSHILQRHGAAVVSLEVNPEEFSKSQIVIDRPLVGDGRRLPLSDGAFDIVFCSNVLEHTPDSFSLIDEAIRVLKADGFCYVSWTNWLSPWGGHAVAPLHYLGAERSIRVWTRLFGPPKGKNLPLDGVWPYSIGEIERYLKSKSGVEIISMYPRYYPKMALLMKFRGVREILAWNCVIQFRKL
jgi:SAM-dependent methyltransferase